MEIATHKKDKVMVVDVKGRLDTTNYNSLENELFTMIDKGNLQIIIDCKSLNYVSSSGLRVFLVAFKKLKALNGKFALSNLQDNIKEIFEISGFITIFDIYSTSDEALIALSN